MRMMMVVMMTGSAVCRFVVMTIFRFQIFDFGFVMRCRQVLFSDTFVFMRARRRRITICAGKR